MSRHLSRFTVKLLSSEFPALRQLAASRKLDSKGDTKDDNKVKTKYNSFWDNQYFTNRPTTDQGGPRHFFYLGYILVP